MKGLLKQAVRHEGLMIRAVPEPDLGPGKRIRGFFSQDRFFYGNLAMAWVIVV